MLFINCFLYAGYDIEYKTFVFKTIPGGRRKNQKSFGIALVIFIFSFFLRRSSCNNKNATRSCGATIINIYIHIYIYIYKEIESTLTNNNNCYRYMDDIELVIAYRQNRNYANTRMKKCQSYCAGVRKRTRSKNTCCLSFFFLTPW